MLYLIGVMIAKLMSAFVFVYTLYFLSYKENRELVVGNFLNLSNEKRVPLLVFVVLSFCIFVGNFI